MMDSGFAMRQAAWRVPKWVGLCESLDRTHPTQKSRSLDILNKNFIKKDRIWWPKWIWMALGCLISLSSWPWWATRYHRQILHIQYIQPTHQTYETTRANKVARIRGKMAGLCWLLLRTTLALTLDQSQGRRRECRRWNTGSISSLWWGKEYPKCDRYRDVRKKIAHGKFGGPRPKLTTNFSCTDLYHVKFLKILTTGFWDNCIFAFCNGVIFTHPCIFRRFLADISETVRLR